MHCIIQSSVKATSRSYNNLEHVKQFINAFESTSQNDRGQHIHNSFGHWYWLDSASSDDVTKTLQPCLLLCLPQPAPSVGHRLLQQKPVLHAMLLKFQF